MTILRRGCACGETKISGWLARNIVKEERESRRKKYSAVVDGLRDPGGVIAGACACDQKTVCDMSWTSLGKQFQKTKFLKLPPPMSPTFDPPTL